MKRYPQTPLTVCRKRSCTQGVEMRALGMLKFESDSVETVELFEEYV